LNANFPTDDTILLQLLFEVMTFHYNLLCVIGRATKSQ